jgi:hypothetical protein
VKVLLIFLWNNVAAAIGEQLKSLASESNTLVEGRSERT